MARPSRSNANTHPAKVLLEGKTKRRTPAEKRAQDAAAAEKNWEEAARAEKEHEDGIKRIAAMEDSLKRDDRNYGKDAPPYRPQADTSTHKAKGYYSVAKAASDDEEPESDEAYQPSQPSDSESQNSKVNSEETGDDSEVGEPEEDDDGSSVEGVRKPQKGKKRTASKEKKRFLREEITKARKTTATAGTMARKRKETESQEPDTAERGSLQTKRAKGAHSSNLQADWKKIVGLTTKSVRYNSIRVSDEELVPAASETCSRSMSGASSHSTMSRATTPPFEGDGEFDHNETPESLAATRKHKGSNPKLPKKTGTAGMKSARVTANMGLMLTRKGADDAVVEEIRRSEDKSKPLKKLKLEDLPFVDKKDHEIWGRLICALIDWAGTTTDPFGTNEHPEVSGKLQELWDVLFAHNKVDVAKCPAIKKVATDWLNEWWSMLGKNAIKILECKLRKAEYRDNTTLVSNLSKIAYLRKLMVKNMCHSFTLIMRYGLKGSWLAPVLLELLAAHARRCGTSFQAFGKPAGALGVCAATAHRALFLYKDGDSAKEAAKDAKRAGLPSQPTKNVSFDAAWGSVAMQYSLQTAQLPHKKWDQIVDGMWELVGEDSLVRHAHVASDDDSMDVRNAIPLSDDDEDIS
ncbi:hypothetical protein DEU56DRAFT_919045 [Suillus clintonianus]|uniref:uncharacterized protein n=1 Tax=Suillus clintonianus TaxID=1904413 RepID=UPI001B86B809|nr:uncharacterized protein DEU56DRAFT_919045 [Suillus clintonianus]KAG2117588.1 hypothetical protein DEU56DRAFT_919045 [Suillus clintonianus]